MKNNIVLIGYMGSGKSTIAKLLAKQLHFEALDLDTYITSETGLSISTIFKTKGEVYFRTLENKLLKQLLNTKTNCVLALGGGTPCYGDTMSYLKTNAITVYLNTSVAVLEERLKTERQTRPLIAALDTADLKEFIAKHLFERRPFYEQAQIQIEVSDKTPTELVDDILKVLEEK